MDLINTTFQPENVKKVCDAWNCTPAEHRMSETWCEEYFPVRNERIVQYIQEEFDLGNPVKLQLQISDTTGGTIAINSISPELSKKKAGTAYGADPTLAREFTWTGLYFPDYPVTLTACPASGYHFAEWKINGNSYSQEESIELSLSSDGTIVEAVFTK